MRATLLRPDSVTVAIDAMHSASNPHAFMGVTEQGLAAIVKTRGNKDVHVILRGGTKGPNYASEHVRKAAQDIEKKAKVGKGEKPFASVMVDCSRACPPSPSPPCAYTHRFMQTATRARTTATSRSSSRTSARSSRPASAALRA